MYLPFLLPLFSSGVILSGRIKVDYVSDMTRRWQSCDYRATCKSRERRFTSPLRRDFELDFRKMEPPFTLSQLKIALEVGLQLIHPDFCKWLYSSGSLFIPTFRHLYKFRENIKKLTFIQAVSATVK